MIQLLKRLFATSAPVAAGSPDAPAAEAVSAPVAEPGGGEGLEGFVLYVVRSLVDSPDSVRVTSAETDRATVLTVSCEKKDIGKIIGKSGRTIAAIRALANGAGGRLGKRVNVEVQD